MKKINLIFLMLTLVLCCCIGNAITFKLAVFDNPEVDASGVQLSQDLQSSYMQGINTGIYVAKKSRIQINEKTFFYGSSLLNMMQKSSSVTSWNPDAIIGLYSSNAMLMSKNSFTNPLVVSISATDIHLDGLPKNFYSLGTPDQYATKKLADFISEKYPNRNLFIIVGAESKESLGFATLITNAFEQKNPKFTVTQTRFLSDDISTMDVRSLTQGYQPGDVILLLSIPGTFNIQIDLMNKIADYLKPNKLIFITPIDNWQGSNFLVSTHNADNSYNSLRFDGLYVDENSTDYKTFSQNFKELYHVAPTDRISYMTYRAVMSIVTAIEKYPPPKNLSPQKAVLWSYQKALQNNPNWFRPEHLAIFKIEGNKETFVTTIN